jgi:hypothetical protein
MRVLKPQDVAILLKVLLKRDQWTIAGLAGDLHMSASEVHAGLYRTMHARLFNIDLRQVQVANFEDFMFHGMQYVFMLTKGQITRGVPTSLAAPPLNKVFDEPEYPPVWPHPKGSRRGYEIVPLYKRAADAALADPNLYELLALVDGIRDNGARVRKLAKDQLRERLEQYRDHIKQMHRDVC